MSYALISEAWKVKDGKLKERDFKKRPEVNRIVEPFDNMEKFPSPHTKQQEQEQPNGLAYQYYQDFLPFDDDEDYDSDDELDHVSVLNHIKNCEVCQKQIVRERFGENNNPLNVSDNVLDILLYTITGIFILFLLDIVLRVGKSLK